MAGFDVALTDFHGFWLSFGLALPPFGTDFDLLLASEVVVSLPKTEAFSGKNAFDYWGLF